MHVSERSRAGRRLAAVGRVEWSGSSAVRVEWQLGRMGVLYGLGGTLLVTCRGMLRAGRPVGAAGMLISLGRGCTSLACGRGHRT